MKIVDPCTAGDPDQDGVLWTNLSRPRIAQELLQQGFRVSVNVVSQLLQRHRLGRRKARKALPLGEHPHRDRQFRIIAHYRAEFDQSPDPIVSRTPKPRSFWAFCFAKGGSTRKTVRSTIPSSIDSSRTLRKLAKACC